MRLEGNGPKTGDNAPAHRSVSVKDFLAKNNVTALEHLHILFTRLQIIFLPVSSSEISIEITSLF
jgi:hypothetical protein